MNSWEEYVLRGVRWLIARLQEVEANMVGRSGAPPDTSPSERRYLGATRTEAPGSSTPSQGGTFTNPITVQYVNSRGKSKTFTANRDSLRWTEAGRLAADVQGDFGGDRTVYLTLHRQLTVTLGTGQKTYTGGITNLEEIRPFLPPMPQADFSNPITVEYVNFRGEAKTFQLDRRSVRQGDRHLSAYVAPAGTRIALDWDRITNLAAVRQELPGATGGEFREV